MTITILIYMAFALSLINLTLVVLTAISLRFTRKLLSVNLKDINIMAQIQELMLEIFCGETPSDEKINNLSKQLDELILNKESN